MKILCAVSLILIAKPLVISGKYNRAYIENLCDHNGLGIWNLGSGNSNSSGILETSKHKKFLPGKNCTITIRAPLGYGVILSIRLLDFRPFYPRDCKSYIEISGEQKPTTLCGYSDDLSEYQSYFSEGKPMTLNFITVNDTGPQYHSEVMLVATSYVKFSYSCEMKMFRCENARCIWKGLTCDGHNNCGDQSDEFSRRLSNCGVLSPGVIAGIVVGSVMGFIVLIIIAIAFCRCFTKNPQTDGDPPLIQPDPIYNTNVRRESIQRLDDAVRPSSSYGRDLPPAYKP